MGGGGLHGDDTLPLSLYEMGATGPATLHPYTREALDARAAVDSAAAAADVQASVNYGLWKSGHPLAACLRENDLDNDQCFYAGAGFGVVVCAQLADETTFESELGMALPLRCFQPIKVR